MRRAAQLGLMTVQGFQLQGMLLLLDASTSLACTAVGIGREVSSTGYPMVTHSEDGELATNDIRLIRVPRKRWPAGSLRPLYYYEWGYPRIVSSQHSPETAPVGDQQETEPIGHIPQVPETWAYWDTEYGVQNEKGLSMGGGTSPSKTRGWPVKYYGQRLEYGYNRAGIEDLTKIAMERCDTARCAVETMGGVAVEQGYYVNGPDDIHAPTLSDSGDDLLVADRKLGELWVFNILTGKNNASAIWAAQRIPPNHIAVAANSFSIGKMNLSDAENFKYSPGVTQLAEEKGWWRREDEASPELFDFFRAYGYDPKATNPEVVYSARLEGKTPEDWAAYRAMNLAYYSGRRIWRIYNLLSPLEGSKLDPQRKNMPTSNYFPTSVPAPRGTVTRRMVMEVHRDYYQGTPFDLTKGVAAGPYGNPNRGAFDPAVEGWFERAISTERTNWAFLNEARPHNRSIMWFAYDAPHGSIFLPFYAAATAGAPESYHSHEGHMSKFSKRVAWWAYNFINQYTEINFQLINADVRRKAKEFEDEAERRIVSWEAEADQLIATVHGGRGELEAMDLLTARSNQFAEEVLAKWWEFSEELISKYGRHVVTHNETITGVIGDAQKLPAWWLRSPEVGFSTWSPSGPYHGVFLNAQPLPEWWLRSPNLGFSTWLPSGSYFLQQAQNQLGIGYGTVPAVPTMLAMALMTVAAYQLGLRHRGQDHADDKAFHALA